MLYCFAQCLRSLQRLPVEASFLSSWAFPSIFWVSSFRLYGSLIVTLASSFGLAFSLLQPLTISFCVSPVCALTGAEWVHYPHLPSLGSLTLKCFWASYNPCVHLYLYYHRVVSQMILNTCLTVFSLLQLDLVTLFCRISAPTVPVDALSAAGTTMTSKSSVKVS